VQESKYLLTCFRYIELNPVRAAMIKDPGDHRWSSYRAHAFGINARLWSPHELYRGPGKNGKQPQDAWRDLTNETLDIEVLAKVRHWVNTGLVLGTESFREQVHRLRS
jgi:putative transposase